MEECDAARQHSGRCREVHGCASPESLVLDGTAHALTSHMPCNVPAAGCMKCSAGRSLHTTFLYCIKFLACPAGCMLACCCPAETTSNCPRALEHLLRTSFRYCARKGTSWCSLCSSWSTASMAPLSSSWAASSLCHALRSRRSVRSFRMPLRSHCRVRTSIEPPVCASRPTRQPFVHFLTMTGSTALQGLHVRLVFCLHIPSHSAPSGCHTGHRATHCMAWRTGSLCCHKSLMEEDSHHRSHRYAHLSPIWVPHSGSYSRWSRHSQSCTTCMPAAQQGSMLSKPGSDSQQLEALHFLACPPEPQLAQL